VFRKVREGILSNISVGYRVHKMVKIEDGEDKTPVYRVEDWEPYELSVVPIGADAGAVTRAQQNDFNPCVFATRQETAAMPDPNETPNAPSADKIEETVARRCNERSTRSPSQRREDARGERAARRRRGCRAESARASPESRRSRPARGSATRGRRR
jgi:hypothetical protein